MHVTAFVPAVQAALPHPDGGVTASGLPMSQCLISAPPMHVTVPIVLSVWTTSGTDYDPVVYIVANDPDGERRAEHEYRWHWPDTHGDYKFRVFVHEVEIHVEKAGVYRVGLFRGPDDTETEHWFPLPIVEQPR